MTTSEATLIPAFHELMEVRRRRAATDLPTVIGVGAGRCGTTTLFNIFSKSSEVYVPPVKEVNFFGRRELSKELYGLYFCFKQNERHTCEISPYYLSQAGVAEQIKGALGSIKIIVQIREPVGRFVSHYRHNCTDADGIKYHENNGLVDISVYIKRALSMYNPKINENREWYSPEKVLSQSLYFSAVENYARVFGQSNVLVIDYPELGHPERVSRALSGFLEIPIEPSFIESSNESSSAHGAPSTSDVARLRDFFGDDYQLTQKAFSGLYETLARETEMAHSAISAPCSDSLLV